MKVTYETLTANHSCRGGLKDFKKHFPEGIEEWTKEVQVECFKKKIDIMSAHQLGMIPLWSMDSVDFSDCDLSGVNFIGLSLVGAKFTRCNLQKARFDHANLTGAEFGYADAKGANFRNACMNRVSNLVRT